MVLDGSRRAQSELDRTLEQIIARQNDHAKRVERLETLEFQKVTDGNGCVFWDDYVEDVGASLNVEFLPTTNAYGDYVGTQATIFWWFSVVSENAINNLYMRINANATANYYWAAKYSKGGALTQTFGDAQNEYFVGRIPYSTGGQAMGVIHIPFWSIPSDQSILCSWTLHEDDAGANFQEKGEVGGFLDQSIGTRSISFDFFSPAGNLSGRAYLYGWCPPITPGGLPGD